MNFEAVFSTAMLGVFIWAARFLVPKAFEQRDPLAITAAALTALFALVMWLLVGIGTRSID